MKKLLVILVLLVGLTSCTENFKAKQMGGTMTVDLPAGQKLIEVTWKEDQMWYLTRARREGEAPETFEFKEKSSMGFMEGTVIFKEQ